MDLQVDVRSVLPAISAPTLVIHRSGDHIAPVEAGRYIAEHIPGATFVQLPGDFHLSARPGAEDEAMDLVEQFLTGTRGEHEIDASLPPCYSPTSWARPSVPRLSGTTPGTTFWIAMIS
jgi:hypothetical protein